MIARQVPAMDWFLSDINTIALGLFNESVLFGMVANWKSRFP